MRTEKRVVYPYVSLDVNGNFNSIGVYTWKIEDNINLEHGYIHIALPPMEVEVTVPEEEQLRVGALGMLQLHRDKLRGEFQATLTKLQMLENNLMRIAAPEGVEVLDAIPQAPHRDFSRCTHCEKQKSKHHQIGERFFCTNDPDDSTEFEEDDIPF